MNNQESGEPKINDQEMLYITAYSKFPHQLDCDVDTYLRKGYELHGNPYMDSSSGIIYQALKKIIL